MKIIKNLFSRIRRKVFKSQHEKEVDRFFSCNGDKTLRLQYDKLNEESIVFDIGGYRGDFASDIYSKYNSNILIFEPVSEYYEIIKKRFKKNQKMKIYNIGLGKKNEKINICVDEDASTIFNKNKIKSEESKQIIYIENMIDFCEKYNIKNIDLIKINIEGAEYDLMELLIEKDFLKNIKNIQIQFHNFVENCDERMEKIKKELSKTHKSTYEFIYVWENWELIE